MLSREPLRGFGVPGSVGNEGSGEKVSGGDCDIGLCVGSGWIVSAGDGRGCAACDGRLSIVRAVSSSPKIVATGISVRLRGSGVDELSRVSTSGWSYGDASAGSGQHGCTSSRNDAARVHRCKG